MIIDFPTALYLPILPQSQSDKGNFTFTISSNDPPRPEVIPFPLQRGEATKPLPDKVFSMEDRLSTLGDFVFAMSVGTQTGVGVGNKAYEVGELLDFEEPEETTEISTLNVPEIVDLQQNTNVIDYESAGLTEEEAELVSSSARRELDIVIANLNQLKTQIADEELKIQDNQRLLNEVRKIKDATAALSLTDSTILDKLTVKENELLKERDELITLTNSLITQADQEYRNLLEIKEVAR